MDWRRFIEEAYASRTDARPVFQPGVAESEVRAAERALRACVPEDLRSLLLATDGVLEEIRVGDRWIPSIWLIWNLRELQDSRHPGRGSGLPGDRLAFAGAGVDGILFALGASRAQGVIAWHPMEGRSQVVAPSLSAFIAGWLSGAISV